MKKNKLALILDGRDKDYFYFSADYSASPPNAPVSKIAGIEPKPVKAAYHRATSQSMWI